MNPVHCNTGLKWEGKKHDLNLKCSYFELVCTMYIINELMAVRVFGAFEKRKRVDASILVHFSLPVL